MIFKNLSNKGFNNIVFLNLIFFLIVKILILTNINTEIVNNITLNSNLTQNFKHFWVIITSMFTHLNFLELLINLYYFYFFVNLTSQKLNSISLITLYIFGGLSGALFYFLLNQPHFVGVTASSGIFSVITFSAINNWNKKVKFIGIIKAKWIFLFLISLSIYGGFKNSDEIGINHIGGILFGCIYTFILKYKNVHSKTLIDKKNLNNPITNNIKSTGFRGGMDRRDVDSINIAIQNFKSKEDLEEEMDKLLSRVKKIGYDNLNEEDKQRLLYLSKKL
jgi:membrane associated rhomboid family serine protease